MRRRLICLARKPSWGGGRQQSAHQGRSTQAGKGAARPDLHTGRGTDARRGHESRSSSRPVRERGFGRSHLHRRKGSLDHGRYAREPARQYRAGQQGGPAFRCLAGADFTGTVHSVGWGIDTGRTASSGLVQNEPETRWFEPARRFPVRIELDRALSEWPRTVRVGAKATVVVYAAGESNPSAWIAMALHRAQSLLSYLY